MFNINFVPVDDSVTDVNMTGAGYGLLFTVVYTRLASFY